MKTKNKIIIISIISTVLFLCSPTYSKAFSFSSLMGDAQGFLEQGNGSQPISEDGLKNISNTVSGILLTIAVAVTFISIAAMGISFAIQTVEDKAKIKESMVPWIIGVFISFGAYGIWKFVMGIFYGMNL